jgi:exocyst complex component 4
LAQTILFTIHLELRLETYYHIEQTFVRGNYFLSRSDSIEPDLKIIELNSLINSYSENSIVKNLVRTEDRRFPFLGLVNLIDDLMITNVKKLSLANEIGFKKLAKNSIALQQNMKSILLNNRLIYHHRELSKDLQMDSNNPVPVDAKSALSFDPHFERCRKFWENASKGPQVSDPRLAVFFSGGLLRCIFLA